MKFIAIHTLILISLLQVVLNNIDTYLKVTIVEATNLHCKLNNELYCNPYAEISFKYSTISKTSKSATCTKHPYFDSVFEFQPQICEEEEIYIHFYQFITPRDQAFLESYLYNEKQYDQGEIKPGYLGRIIIKFNH